MRFWAQMYYEFSKRQKTKKKWICTMYKHMRCVRSNVCVYECVWMFEFIGWKRLWVCVCRADSIDKRIVLPCTACWHLEIPPLNCCTWKVIPKLVSVILRNRLYCNGIADIVVSSSHAIWPILFHKLTGKKIIYIVLLLNQIIC